MNNHSDGDVQYTLLFKKTYDSNGNIQYFIGLYEV